MEHEILGVIDQTNCDPFDAVATVRHGSREVKIGIQCDGEPLESMLNFATEIVSQLGELDSMAKKIVTKELRESYNSGWNEYDEAQDDGSFMTVTNPQLSEAEFEAKLSLKGVNIVGEQGIDFFYDDEGMFWGHSLMVSSFDGLDLSKARAQMWG